MKNWSTYWIISTIYLNFIFRMLSHYSREKNLGHFSKCICLVAITHPSYFSLLNFPSSTLTSCIEKLTPLLFSFHTLIFFSPCRSIMPKILHTSFSESACLLEQRECRCLKGGLCCSLYRGNYVKTEAFFHNYLLLFQQLWRAIIAHENTEWERKGEKEKGPGVTFRHKTEACDSQGMCLMKTQHPLLIM